MRSRSRKTGCAGLVALRPLDDGAAREAACGLVDGA